MKIIKYVLIILAIVWVISPNNNPARYDGHWVNSRGTKISIYTGPPIKVLASQHLFPAVMKWGELHVNGKVIEYKRGSIYLAGEEYKKLKTG